MSDELRDAAERVMKATGKALAFPERLDANARAFLGDAYNVARAYLNPWRPISEAPRDGTEVDLWMEIPRSATNFGDSFRVPDCSYRKGKWGHQHKGGWTELRQECITHWTTLPLPPAPAA